MIVYALAFNLPFILTNRYNRVRLKSLLALVETRHSIVKTTELFEKERMNNEEQTQSCDCWSELQWS